MRRTLVFSLLFLGLASCKQGVGEICQIDSDCDTGLTCSKVADQSVQHCQKGSTTSPPDANSADAEPIDAQPLDAVPLDAGPPDA